LWLNAHRSYRTASNCHVAPQHFRLIAIASREIFLHPINALLLASLSISTVLCANAAHAADAVAPAVTSTSPLNRIENSLGMKFVLVPAGEFMMGNDETPEALAKVYPQYERQRLTDLYDEAPVHRVNMTKAFYLGQFEVTVGQFRKFIDASGYVPESIADGTGG
jgi:formylglycine-generating enzyme required for sulfatase activity